MAAAAVSLERARAHWARTQGLEGELAGGLVEVVTRSGWPRAFAGADVYLAVRARVPGMKRATLDAAVERGELQVVPAVRGCMYLVPRAEVPLVLRVAEEQHRKRADRDLEKAGVRPGEIAEVIAAVKAALRGGPLTTDGLRKALAPGVVRSLGERGKKVGISSPLPPALRQMEFDGGVERTPEGGRVDGERYLWRVPGKARGGPAVPADPAERHARLADRFFRACGPTRLVDFAEWSALSQKDARAAITRAGLAPIAIEGHADEAFVPEELLAALAKKGAAPVGLAFLPFEDNLVIPHGGPAPLVNPAHHGMRAPTLPGIERPMTLGEVKHLTMRPLYLAGKIAGLWEYDPDAEAVVFGGFADLPAGRRKAAQALAQDVGAFLRDEIGHARFAPNDTTEALRDRARAVKRLR